MLIGNLSSKLISFLLLPLYTRYLSTEAYGESDVINVYASILLAIVTCCVADAMFVYPKNEDEEGKKKYFNSGIIFCLFSFSALALVIWALDVFFDSNVGGVLLLDKWWIYFTAFSLFIQQYCQQFTLSLDKTTNYALAGIILTILLAVFAVLLLPILGLKGYLLSIILANIGAALFSFFSSKSYKYLSIRHIDKCYAQKLLAYGIPLIPNSLMWWLVNGINRPVMEMYLGLSAIGIFSVANRFPSVLSMVFVVVAKGMSISVIDEFEKPDFNFFYNRILRAMTTVVLLLGVLLCVFSKAIIILFTDEEYFTAWQYMPLLTLAVIFQCMGGFIGNVFMAEKKSKYFFYSSFWAAIASLVLTFTLISFLDVFGVCIAVVTSFFVMFLTRLFYAWKHINKFSIKYYSLIFFIYIALVVLVTIDVAIYYQIIAVLLFGITICYTNKNDLILLSKQLKSHKIFRK